MQSSLTVGDVAVAEEPSVPAISWAPIFAGAVAAAAVTLLLMLVGGGLGLTSISPWSGESVSATSFGVGAGVWLVLTQWFASAIGGDMTGRLRTKWVAVHTDEAFFRDTAHGLLAWAVATLIVAGVMTSAVSSIVGSGVQAASTVASGAALGATAGADEMSEGASMYYVDMLFRRPANAAATADAATAEFSASEASRILLSAAASGELPDAPQGRRPARVGPHRRARG